VFFSFSEKQIHQVGKFHHKKHCHYLSTYFFFFLFGIISWHLTRCYPIRSFTLLMNGHNIYLLVLRGLWIDMKCLGAFHNRNVLGNFSKCFVICTPHSLIHWAHITLLQLFMTKSIPTGAAYVTLHITIGWRNVNLCRCSSGNWCAANLLGLLRLVKNVAKLCTCKRRL
jgi:hypothetical protein